MQITPFAYPAPNWGYNYQVVRSNRDMTYLQDNYNNFVDHVAGRINELSSDIAKTNGVVNSHSSSLNSIQQAVNNNTTNLAAHSGYIFNLDRTTQGLNTTLNAHGGYINNIDKLTQKHTTELNGQSSRILNNQVRLNGIDSTLTLFSGYINNLDKITKAHTVDLAGQSSRILSNQVRLNGIDTTLTSFDGFFKNLENKTKATDLKVAENSGYIKNIDVLTKGHTTDLVGQSSRILNNQVRLNTVDSALLLNDGYIKNLEKKSIETDTKFMDFDGYVKNLSKRADTTDLKLIEYDGYINSLDKLSKKNQLDITALAVNTGDADRNLQTQITEMKVAEVASTALILNSLSSLKDSVTEFNQYFYADPISYENGINSSDGVFSKVVKGQFTRLISELNRLSTIQIGKMKDYTTQLTTLNTSILGVGKIKDYTTSLTTLNASILGIGKLKDYTTQLTNLNASTLLNGTKLDSFSKKNDENLTFLLSAISLIKNYDDTTLKSHITDRFSQYFKSTNYETGIESTDGIFTKVIKGQFTRIIAELNRIFTLQINKFNELKTALSTLNLNISEQFTLLFEWISLQIDSLNLLNGNILISLKSLSTVNDWLELIFNKQTGNIINPAPEGTNFWDVLKSLVDSLGSLLESIISIVPDLIQKLIDLIIPSDPNFFGSRLSSLSDTFKSKFNGVLKISDTFKSIYTSSSSSSLTALKITILGQHYPLFPSFFISNLPLLRNFLSGILYLFTLITAYRRIVGGGDVIS